RGSDRRLSNRASATGPAAEVGSIRSDDVIARLAASASLKLRRANTVQPRRSLGVVGTGRPSIPETSAIDRGFPAYWMPAGACHRARRRRDPLAAMTGLG